MDAPVKAGDIIDGRYRLERIIGSGGMAVVVAAIDTEASERVALKFLFKKAARQKDVLRRFKREKEVIGRLVGEHVARILNSGVVKNTPYMVMEYLQGHDLSKVLRVQKTLPVETATEYVLQTCDAVAEAHGLDIVHRDLKPGNLFLTHRWDGSPCIKVLDFGIAKLLSGGSGEQGSLTRTEVVMGSPFYMSPEQMLSSKDVGPATDIWALGVILYQLLAGKIPFAAASTDQVCARVLHGEHTPLREECADCPDGLEEIIARCLRRMPQDRYADVAALASDLAPFAPPHARFLVPRIRDRLELPGEPPPSDRTISNVAEPSDPEEAPDAPTVYVSRERRVKAGPLLFVAFGLGMLSLGFAGGALFRGQLSVVPSADTTKTATASASVSTFLSAVEKRRLRDEEAELVIPETQIEIDFGQENPRETGERKPATSQLSVTDSTPGPGATPSSASPIRSDVPVGVSPY